MRSLSSQQAALGALRGMPLQWLVLFSLLVAACNSNTVPPEAKVPINTAPPTASGNAAMVKQLQAIAKSVNPEGNIYASKARVAHYQQLLAGATPDKMYEYKYRVAQELLNAGETDQAIQEIKGMLQLLGQHADQIDKSVFKDLNKMLAIAYMRKGEVENCQLNHSAQSCLFPIQGSGVHQLPEGSRSAIEIYKQLLKEYPDDLDSRWLLNVAYMTLGAYPQNVPPDLLIPADAFASDYKLTPWKEVATPAGLDVVGPLGACALEDFNNDLYLDVIASSWGYEDQLRFFQSNGDGTFTERTNEAGLEGLTGGINLLVADYNNDSFRDIFILRGAWLYENGKIPNSLLRNNGNGTFSDVTQSAGVFSKYPTQTAAWGDFNLDGNLDLFIGNETARTEDYYCELYQNNGDGTFKEVAQLVGIKVKEIVKGAVWGDYNNDGREDLYLSCLTSDNYLFRNDGPNANGQWQFTNVAKIAGVTEPRQSFPAWFFDYNNDGWQDIFVSGYYAENYGYFAAEIAAEYLGKPVKAEKPRLYRNKGDGTFEDVTKRMGLDRVLFTMGCNYGDLDNDGWLDFYLGTGEPDYRSIIPNLMFRNNEGRGFQDVTTSGGFGHLQKGHGISFGDIDNDGDQDIYTVLGGAYDGDVFQNALFENPGAGNNWVTLLFQGTKSNFDGIGTRVKLTIQTPNGPKISHYTVSTGASFGNNSLNLEIGVGKAQKIDLLEVFWPASQVTQSFKNVAVNCVLLITEGKKEIMQLKTKSFKLPHTGGHHGHMQ